MIGHRVSEEMPPTRTQLSRIKKGTRWMHLLIFFSGYCVEENILSTVSEEITNLKMVLTIDVDRVRSLSVTIDSIHRVRSLNAEVDEKEPLSTS